MKCIKDPLKEFQTMDMAEFFKLKDPLSDSRKEHKFLLPIEVVPEFLEFIRSEYFLITDGESPVHHYQTVYFDTADYKFFNLHRQGKYNRIKVRLREYKTLQANSFIECKRKVKGRKTHKYRIRIQNISDHHLNHDFIRENLQEHGLKVEDLSHTLKMSYDRIFLYAKNGQRRISIDYDLVAKTESSEPLGIVPGYAILEIKEEGLPHKIIRYLKREHGIRQTSFSKYCVALCLLEPGLKINKWKQTLKHQR